MDEIERLLLGEAEPEQKKTTKKRRRGSPTAAEYSGIDNRVQAYGDVENQASTWSDRKIIADAVSKELDNIIKIGDMIPKKMMQGFIGQISQGIKNNFVDLPRREAELLSARLGIPEKARDLERMWSEYNRTAIENMKAEVEKLQKDDIYE
jgi:hypothetical protein